VTATDDGSIWLGDFASLRPAHETAQTELLAWLADAHAVSAQARAGLSDHERVALRERLRRAIDRCACGPDHIARRGHVVADVGSRAWDQHRIYDLRRHPSGAGAGERTRVFGEVATGVVERLFHDVVEPPGNLVHVTCTGYLAPSAAQRLVDRRGWHGTRVTHAYHMGCYAALPAVRIAAGELRLPAALAAATRAVDIVHTEMCSLHFDPGASTLEQLVVQSLFADGFIRYRAAAAPSAGGWLRVLALDERVVPASGSAMAWQVGDGGMMMTLARDVPDRIGGALRGFVDDLLRRAGFEPRRALARCAAAIHPGGPRIVDQVARLLGLDDAQVATSRAVLRDHGNMSSATLPHVWMRMAADPALSPATPIVSLAFGPGLTLCGGVLCTP
jgi:predicted naringenin-chalcone synthase